MIGAFVSITQYRPSHAERLSNVMRRSSFSKNFIPQDGCRTCGVGDPSAKSVPTLMLVERRGIIADVHVG
jgi:hypothetical protein